MPLGEGLARLVSLPEVNGYWPHVAVAYATGQGRIESVHRSWFRSVTGLNWRVQTVAFVKLRRSPRRYLWDVLAEVLIGRAGRFPPDAITPLLLRRRVAQAHRLQPLPTVRPSHR